MSKIELYHGDCLEVMKQIPDGAVDMVLCDLPYGTTACKWDVVIPFEPLWEQWLRVSKQNAALVLTASQPFTSALVMSNPSLFRHEWIWIKNIGGNFCNTVREPFKEHEEVLVFSRGKWTYNPQPQRRTGGGAKREKYGHVWKSASDNYRVFPVRVGKKDPGSRVPSSWQKFNVERGLHPTQKPVALLSYLIRTYTNEGETVLDNCMGSGSTGVACVQADRNFIGIEKETKYFEIAKHRIELEQSKPKQLELLRDGEFSHG